MVLNPRFEDRFVRVNEGEAAEIRVIYKVPAGLAAPRTDNYVSFRACNLSAFDGDDFDGGAFSVNVPHGDWAPMTGGGITQTVTRA